MSEKYTGYYDTNETFYTIEKDGNDLMLGDVLETIAALRAELDAVRKQRDEYGSSLIIALDWLEIVGRQAKMDTKLFNAINKFIQLSKAEASES